MKSLFNPADNQEIIDRINRLSVNAKPLWGRMNVAQMLAHCQQPLKVAYGEAKGTQSFVGKLFGKLAKKQLLSGKPMKKNLPTDKTFVVADNREFSKEKDHLIALVHKFQSGGP